MTGVRSRLTGAFLVLLVAGCGAADDAGRAQPRPAEATSGAPGEPSATPTATPATTAPGGSTGGSSDGPAPTGTTGTTGPATATVVAPEFVWTTRRATARNLGSSWRKGCPVPPSKLRIVRLTYWTFDGRVAAGDLVLHRDVVDRTRPVFALMFRERFPLRSVRAVTAFGSSDDRSMAADNTSAFNCRRAVAAGPPSWSRHAYGMAVDVNPVENPYLFHGDVLPPNGTRFADRRRAAPGKIRKGDAIHRAFLAAGYRWGGTFSNPDFQHFDR